MCLIFVTETCWSAVLTSTVINVNTLLPEVWSGQGPKTHQALGLGSVLGLG